MMAAPLAVVENTAMTKRGPYRKAPKTAPPQWRRTFILEWRTFRGMTQEELAAKADLAVGTLSAIEQAKAGYSAESLSRLAKALKAEPGMLLSVNPLAGEPLWSLWTKASDDERDQIERVARAIIGGKS